MSENICLTPATDIAERIRNGQLSPVDVVERHLERIENQDSRINAFVTVSEEYARQKAHEAEKSVESGEELGRLHGVPIATKDLYGFKSGIRNTFGSKLFKDNVSEEDAIFVERLEAEGAIIVGKTNTPEFGLGPITDNLVTGLTRNPFAPADDINAGGSSGGAAAAVAGGMVPIAQGSDAGGSIRIPSSCCGVFGMKPSFGRIPRVRGMRPCAFQRHTPFSQFGPIGRTVRDTALMMDIMAGPHPRDPFTMPEDGTNYVSAIDQPIDSYEIAYTADFGIFPVEPTVREIVDDAADAFAVAGADVQKVEPEFNFTQQDILNVFYKWLQTRMKASLENMAQQHDLDPLGEDMERLRPKLRETIINTEDISAVEYYRTDVVRTEIFDTLQDVFSEYDLIISPTVGIPPFNVNDPPTEIDGVEIEPLRGWVLTQLFNMSGHPAASIPAGFLDGLPVGLQIAGRRFADETVIAASAAFEEQEPWHDAYESV